MFDEVFKTPLTCSNFIFELSNSQKCSNYFHDKHTYKSLIKQIHIRQTITAEQFETDKKTSCTSNKEQQESFILSAQVAPSWHLPTKTLEQGVKYFQS